MIGLLAIDVLRLSYIEYDFDVWLFWFIISIMNGHISSKDGLVVWQHWFGVQVIMVCFGKK